MDHYLNLKSTSSDGTEVITMIRPGTQAGNLLSKYHKYYFLLGKDGSSQFCILLVV